MKEVRYALSIKGKNTPLKLKENRIKTDKGVNVYGSLNETVGQEWTTKTKEVALEVIKNKGDWFDGTAEKPSHQYEELELIELTEVKLQQIIEKEKNFPENDIVEEVKKEKLEIKRVEDIEEKIQTQQMFETKNNTVTVEEKVKPIQTIKMVVECKKTMYKELGQIVNRYQPKQELFQKGEKYLGYVKEDKIYVVTKDKTPEFICELPVEEPTVDTLFDIYFDVMEVRK